MSKDAVSDWDTTAGNNTDIGGIDLSPGTAAISQGDDMNREFMAQLAAWYKAPDGPAEVAMAANNIDCSAGIVFTKTISTSTTLTFSNVPAGSFAGMLKLTNGGSDTITLPTGSETEGGSGLTLTASGVDWVAFWTTDGGTSWTWKVIGLDVQ